MLEIGPGFGATTRVLAGRAPALTVLELDERYCQRLRRELGQVVTVVQGATVVTPDDVRWAVRDAQEQHHAWLAVLVLSKSGAQWIPISISGRSS